MPDWPTTYGYNLFLFPMHLWQCNIFYEHTHRLLASFVALLTSILAVWLWLRWLGVGAFFAILLQGLLGGLRIRGPAGQGECLAVPTRLFGFRKDRLKLNVLERHGEGRLY